MKQTINILSHFIITILLGCTDSPIPPNHKLSFTAEYASETRSNKTIPAGITALLHICSTSDSTQRNIFPLTTLHSDGNGAMNPTKNIFVTNGCYNLYSLSYGTSEIPDTEIITNNTLTPSNHKDYLWTSSEETSISGATAINLIYKHIAARITFSIIKPEYCEIITVNSLEYTLPDTSTSILKITEGTITPATNILPPAELPGTGSIREVITIPCSDTSARLTVSIIMTINGFTSSEITYSTTLPFPIQQGVHYTIELTPQKNSDIKLNITKTGWFVKEDIIPYTIS